jgi:hypothetical protein
MDCFVNPKNKVIKNALIYIIKCRRIDGSRVPIVLENYAAWSLHGQNCARQIQL